MSVLDWCPLARITDPETSHEAAADQIESERRDNHAERVLEVVRKMPGCSYRELADAAEFPEAVEVIRRLDDLRKAGLVHAGDKRRCSISGRPSQVWFPGQAA